MCVGAGYDGRVTIETNPQLPADEDIALRHAELFSTRSAGIKQSPIRDVFDISVRPGLISLAGGSPNLAALEVDTLISGASSILSERAAEALNYGGGQGTEELRALAVEIMAQEGITNADPANIVITTGSQSAQDVAAKVFCDPGDVVLTEDPTYVGALNTFEAYQVDVQPVAMDHDGLIPEALSARIAELRGAGKRVKMLYTIPSFGNPSGITMSAERRQRIVDICRENNILVLEDNPYGLLKFDGAPLVPLREGNADDVIYLGSFSKILAPGMRLGWALLPAHLQRRFYLAAEAVVLCPSPLTQMLVEHYFRNSDWQAQLDASRAEYKKRCDAMLEALASEFDGLDVSWTVPDGGFFIWVTLPEGVDTYPMLHEAIDAGVVFIPGAAFSPVEGPSNNLRLAYSTVPVENIREGISRLAPIIKRAL